MTSIGIVSMVFCGRINCDNAEGQLGNGTLNPREMPQMILPQNTMETIPMDVIIARLMRGPADMVVEDGVEEREAHLAKCYENKRIHDQRDTRKHSEFGLPELLQQTVGQFPNRGIKA